MWPRRVRAPSETRTSCNHFQIDSFSSHFVASPFAERPFNLKNVRLRLNRSHRRGWIKRWSSTRDCNCSSDSTAFQHSTRISSEWSEIYEFVNKKCVFEHSKLESGPCLLLIFYSNSHKVYTNVACGEHCFPTRAHHRVLSNAVHLSLHCWGFAMELRRRKVVGKCDKAFFLRWFLNASQ